MNKDYYSADLRFTGIVPFEFKVFLSKSHHAW